MHCRRCSESPGVVVAIASKVRHSYSVDQGVQSCTHDQPNLRPDVHQTVNRSLVYLSSRCPRVHNDEQLAVTLALSYLQPRQHDRKHQR